MTESELDAAVVAARSGDAWAATLLFRDLHPRLLRYLGTQLADAAEDLAAETWLALAPRLGEVDGGIVGLRKLAFTIAHRKVIAEYRRRGIRRTMAADPETLEVVTDTADTAADTLDALSADAAIARLRQILPPEWAEVVLLRVVAGLSAEEVGEIIGKSPGAVRVIQHRAITLAAQSYPRGLVTP